MDSSAQKDASACANTHLPSLGVRPYGIVSMNIDSRNLPIDEFSGMFKSFQSSAWRLELLSAYGVESEDAEFKAFVDGAPLPPLDKESLAGDSPWCKNIRAHVAAGRTMGRVHVLPEVLTPYLRYEIEWGYTYNNAAGDDTRLLPAANISKGLHSLLSGIQDFWLFDDSRVVLCEYDPRGSFCGAREVTDSTKLDFFREVRDAAIADSIDFRTFMRGYRAGQFR